MGKRSNKPKDPQEKAITGSGADVKLIEHDHGMVKCRCIVPCVWRGYRDEGDTVWIEKEMIEGDSFIKAHFMAVDGAISGAGQDGREDGNVGSARSQATEHNDDADGEGDDAGGEDGQGELGLN